MSDSLTSLLHPKYRSDIDGLRALAILSVVFFHIFPDSISGGFIGVDVFFVISGYLISTIILQNLENSRFSFRDFYARRVQRIFPALLTVLGSCLIFGWFTLFGDEYKQLGKHISGGASFISNLISWNEAGYFDVSAESKPLLHLWSLGIEEQFYIFWPFIIWLAWKRKINLWILITLFTALSFYLNIKEIKTDSIATFFSLQTRAWELLSGSLLAFLHLNKNLFLRSTFLEKHNHIILDSLKIKPNLAKNYCCNFLSLLGMTVLMFGFWRINKSVSFPGKWALLPVGGSLLLIAAGTETWINRYILSNKVLVWIGLISFPLYLWHWPLLVSIHILEGVFFNSMDKWMVLFLSFALAWLTYAFIEAPIRVNPTNKKKIASLLLGMLLIALLGLATYIGDGFAFRVPQLIEKINQQFSWPESNNSTKECRDKYPGDQYCLISYANKAPTAALIGDSHANHFFKGLSEYYKEQNKNLLNLGAGACPPFFGIDRGPHPSHGNLHCLARTKPMYDFVLNSSSIKEVWIAFHHVEYFGDEVEMIDSTNSFTKGGNFEKSKMALLRTIKLLESKNKTVYIIYDLPNLKIDIGSCFKTRPLAFHKKKECDYTNLLILDDYKKYNEIIGYVKSKSSVKVFDTRPYWKSEIPVSKEGIPSYRDATHLSEYGSLIFSSKYQAMK